MIALKLVLTPLLIGMASVAGRRWGPVVSGWLIGLPLTSTPVVLFLALEQGTTFATRVAQGTLLGLISQAAFCLAYSWLSFRIGWPGCWLGGWGVFFAATLVFEQVSFPLPLAFAGVVCFLLVALLVHPGKEPFFRERCIILPLTCFILSVPSLIFPSPGQMTRHSFLSSLGRMP